MTNRELLEKVLEVLQGCPADSTVLLMCAAINDRLAQPEKKPTIDGNTSDGYHTFNELYEFRKAYNVALFNEWAANGKCSVHKSWRHHDGELCFGGGWFIVVAVLPQGQISNHYEAKDWDLFRIQETAKALFEFDGHTGLDVIARLKSHTTLAQPEHEPVAIVVERQYDDGSSAGNCLEWNGRNEENDFPVGTVFYTVPPHRQPLTDEHIERLEALCIDPVDASGWGFFNRKNFARAIEAAHGIKEYKND